MVSVLPAADPAHASSPLLKETRTRSGEALLARRAAELFGKRAMSSTYDARIVKADRAVTFDGRWPQPPPPAPARRSWPPRGARPRRWVGDRGASRATDSSGARGRLKAGQLNWQRKIDQVFRPRHAVSVRAGRTLSTPRRRGGRARRASCSARRPRVSDARRPANRAAGSPRSLRRWRRGRHLHSDVADHALGYERPGRLPLEGLATPTGRGHDRCRFARGAGRREPRTDAVWVSGLRGDAVARPGEPMAEAAEADRRVVAARPALAGSTRSSSEPTHYGRVDLTLHAATWDARGLHRRRPVRRRRRGTSANHVPGGVSRRPTRRLLRGRVAAVGRRARLGRLLRRRRGGGGGGRRGARRRRAVGAAASTLDCRGAAAPSTSTSARLTRARRRPASATRADGEAPLAERRRVLVCHRAPPRARRTRGGARGIFSRAERSGTTRAR